MIFIPPFRAVLRGGRRYVAPVIALISNLTSLDLPGYPILLVVYRDRRQSARKTQSNILENYYCNDMVENDTPEGDGHCEGKAEDAESRASECGQCGLCGRLDCQLLPGHGGRQRCLLLYCQEV